MPFIRVKTEVASYVENFRPMGDRESSGRNHENPIKVFKKKD